MNEAAEFPGSMLPRLARGAIAQRLGVGARVSREGMDRRLFEIAASFVTLTRDGGLRGCVGRLEAARALVDDVEENACAAAFEDHRFSPLELRDLDGTRIEVSVLGPLTPLAAASEDQLLSRLEPGEDGLVLVAGGRRATFLPQVWESLPRPRDFLDQLRRKAGLDDSYWRDGPLFFRYAVRKWSEEP